MTERNRELFALIPAALLVTAGFAAVFVQRDDVLTNASLTYGGLFLGLCFVAHLIVRMTLPHADPYLFPLVATLACLGLVVLYRLDEDFAREQAQWFVVGLIVFAATIIALRKDVRVLERYRYVIATAGILLLLLPRVPGIGQQVNGAYLGIGIGPISFQPAELSKIAIVIFLASYLRDTREVLVQGAHKILGIPLPPLKHLGPLLVVWGAAMVLLVFIRDLGSSLMFFGGFLALVYVATNRASYAIIGFGLFAAGDVVLRADRRARAGPRRRVAAPVLRPALRRAGRQLPDRAVDLRPGRRRVAGARLRRGDHPAPRRRSAAARGAHRPHLRGHRQRARPASARAACCSSTCSSSSAASASRRSPPTRSPSCWRPASPPCFALQVFVIVGGVTKLIPLTGVTLPFISYGGSSIVANFILLALLLLVSDRARREVKEPR